MADIKYDASKVEEALDILRTAKELPFSSTEAELGKGANMIRNATGAGLICQIDPGQFQIQVQESKNLIDQLIFAIEDKKEEIEKFESGEDEEKEDKSIFATLGLFVGSVANGFLTGAEGIVDGFVSVGGAIVGTTIGIVNKDWGKGIKKATGDIVDYDFAEKVVGFDEDSVINLTGLAKKSYNADTVIKVGNIAGTVGAYVAGGYVCGGLLGKVASGVTKIAGGTGKLAKAAQVLSSVGSKFAGTKIGGLVTPFAADATVAYFGGEGETVNKALENGATFDEAIGAGTVAGIRNAGISIAAGNIFKLIGKGVNKVRAKGSGAIDDVAQAAAGSGDDVINNAAKAAADGGDDVINNAAKAAADGGDDVINNAVKAAADGGDDVAKAAGITDDAIKSSSDDLAKAVTEAEEKVNKAAEVLKNTDMSDGMYRQAQNAYDDALDALEKAKQAATTSGDDVVKKVAGSMDDVYGTPAQRAVYEAQENVKEAAEVLKNTDISDGMYRQAQNAYDDALDSLEKAKNAVKANAADDAAYMANHPARNEVNKALSERYGRPVDVGEVTIGNRAFNQRKYGKDIADKLDDFFKEEADDFAKAAGIADDATKTVTSVAGNSADDIANNAANAITQSADDVTRAVTNVAGNSADDIANNAANTIAQSADDAASAAANSSKGIFSKIGNGIKKYATGIKNYPGAAAVGVMVGAENASENNEKLFQNSKNNGGNNDLLDDDYDDTDVGSEEVFDDGSNNSPGGSYPSGGTPSTIGTISGSSAGEPFKEKTSKKKKEKNDKDKSNEEDSTNDEDLTEQDTTTNDDGGEQSSTDDNQNVDNTQNNNQTTQDNSTNDTQQNTQQTTQPSTQTQGGNNPLPGAPLNSGGNTNNGSGNYHTGGSYTSDGGYQPEVLETPETLPTEPVEDTLEESTTSIDEIIKQNYTKIPSSSDPITNNTSSKGGGSTIIPVIAGLSAAAAAGIGAKAYLDRKENNDNDEDSDEIETEEWSGEDTLDLEYDNNETQEAYLDDDDDYGYQSSEPVEKYDARSNEELADLQ